MTHKQAVLRLLSDHKPHSHHELYALGCVAHSRVSDLRLDGHKIEKWRENGLYLYRLVALKEAAAVADPPFSASAAASLSVSSLDVPSQAANDAHGGDGTLSLFPTPPRGAYGDAA